MSKFEKVNPELFFQEEVEEGEEEEDVHTPVERPPTPDPGLIVLPVIPTINTDRIVLPVITNEMPKSEDRPEEVPTLPVSLPSAPSFGGTPPEFQFNLPSSIMSKAPQIMAPEPMKKVPMWKLPALPSSFMDEGEKTEDKTEEKTEDQAEEVEEVSDSDSDVSSEEWDSVDKLLCDVGWKQRLRDVLRNPTLCRLHLFEPAQHGAVKTRLFHLFGARANASEEFQKLTQDFPEVQRWRARREYSEQLDKRVEDVIDKLLKSMETCMNVPEDINTMQESPPKAVHVFLENQRTRFRCSPWLTVAWVLTTTSAVLVSRWWSC